MTTSSGVYFCTIAFILAELPETQCRVGDEQLIQYTELRVNFLW